MAHPEVHAKNSVKLFGGKIEDYLEIHDWFDQSKAFYPDWRHRSMRHHTMGIFECEQRFGKSFINSDGKTVYTRYVGEQHVKEDMGFIPTVGDWLDCMDIQQWMNHQSRKVNDRLNKPADEIPTSLQNV